MKFLITKTCLGVIDTGKERNRINKAFKKDPETRDKLNLLMDAIEEQNWDKALEMLESEWWKGRDKRLECPRYEFVGMADVVNPNTSTMATGFNFGCSYIDLICGFINSRPRNSDVKYKMEKIKEKP